MFPCWFSKGIDFPTANMHLVSRGLKQMEVYGKKGYPFWAPVALVQLSVRPKLRSLN